MFAAVRLCFKEIGSGHAPEEVPAGGLGRAPLRITEDTESARLPDRRSTLAA